MGERMWRWSIWGLIGLMLVACGCFDSKVTVAVNTDGSGTIEHEMYVRVEKADEKPKPIEEVKTSCEKAATTMGEGVTVKAVAELPAKGAWRGYRIEYAFTDVTKVKIGYLPLGGQSQPSEESLIRFGFQAGAQPKLTIARPQGTPGGEDKDDEPAPEMVKAFDGARIEFSVRVNGKITSTNAALVNAERNGLVLLRQDVGGLLKDKAAMAALKAISKLKDPKEIQARLQNSAVKKYVEMEPAQEVTVQFQ